MTRSLRALTVAAVAIVLLAPSVEPSAPARADRVLEPAAEATSSPRARPAPTARVPGAPSKPQTRSTRTTAPRWTRRLDALTRGLGVSVAVGEHGSFLYRHDAGAQRAPASNEKLPLSMALLDKLGPSYRIPTRAEASTVSHGVVRGDLWILGRGDPTTNARSLAALARGIASAGVHRVQGSVMGAVAYFRHDWNAPGWKSFYQRIEVAMPTALTYNGNTVNGKHISHPEILAAQALTKELRKRGVAVTGKPGAGRPPSSLHQVADVRSAPLSTLLSQQNHDSINFDAEVLNKLLGATVEGPPGTIAKGGRAITDWASAKGVTLTAYDGSGLSFANRASTAGIVRLLWVADGAPWGPVLRRSLPRAGVGTLQNRLAGIRLRAKTGTLVGHSALSGWVWLRKANAWGEFSILEQGLSDLQAHSLEDRIVRIVAKSAG